MNARRLSAAEARTGAAFGGGAGRALAASVFVLILVYLGAMVWVLLAPGPGSLILVLTLLPMLVIGTALVPWVCGGYRPVPLNDVAALTARPMWHATTQEWNIGDVVTLEQQRCRRSARMFRFDRPFTRSQAAVYLFAEPPTRHHVNGNVKAARAKYLYTLAPKHLDGPAYRRETAVAVTGNVVAAVTGRDLWSRR